MAVKRYYLWMQGLAAAAVFMTISFYARDAACVDKDKDEYRVDRMPPAHFLTPERDQGDYKTYGTEACAFTGPVDGDAYDTLDAIVALRERRSGSQAMRCAAELVKNTFGAMGYQVEFMEYNFPYYEVTPDSFHVASGRDGREFKSFPLMYSPSTSEKASTPVIGKVIKPGLGKNLSGKVILYKPSYFSKHLDKKAAKWEDKGAIGILIDAGMWPVFGNELPYPSRAHATSYHYSSLPGFVTANAFELLGEEVEMSNPSKIFCGCGYNVVAVTPGDYDEYIVVSGHLDAWFGGALDDGSGVAAMIEAADMLKHEKHEVGVIYLAADGEELGLLGSSVFARRFGLENVKAMIELDMVSSLYNYGEDPLGKEERLMPRVIAASPQVEPLAKQAFTGLEAKAYYLGPPLWRSVSGGLPTDMEWFYAAGIPSVFVYCPAKYYHTERDTMEWMHRQDLNSVAEATADLVRLLRNAQLPERVPNILTLDFNVKTRDDGYIEFELSTDPHLKRADAKVYCYYEMGFERKIECERDSNGIYKGEYSPPYTGHYQFLANFSKGKRFGRLWKDLNVKEPGPPEDEE